MARYTPIRIRWSIGAGRGWSLPRLRVAAARSLLAFDLLQRIGGMRGRELAQQRRVGRRACRKRRPPPDACWAARSSSDCACFSSAMICVVAACGATLRFGKVPVSFGSPVAMRRTTGVVEAVGTACSTVVDRAARQRRPRAAPDAAIAGITPHRRKSARPRRCFILFPRPAGISVAPSTTSHVNVSRKRLEECARR